MRPLSVPPKKIRLLDTRVFSLAEIVRIFTLPPSFLSGKPNAG